MRSMTLFGFSTKNSPTHVAASAGHMAFGGRPRDFFHSCRRSAASKKTSCLANNADDLGLRVIGNETLRNELEDGKIKNDSDSKRNIHLEKYNEPKWRDVAVANAYSEHSGKLPWLSASLGNEASAGSKQFESVWAAASGPGPGCGKEGACTPAAAAGALAPPPLLLLLLLLLPLLLSLLLLLLRFSSPGESAWGAEGTALTFGFLAPGRGWKTSPLASCASRCLSRRASAFLALAFSWAFGAAATSMAESKPGSKACAQKTCTEMHTGHRLFSFVTG